MDSGTLNHLDAVQICPEAAYRLVHVPVSASLPDEFAISDCFEFRVLTIAKRHTDNLLHCHDVLEVGCCLEGTGVLVAERRVHTLQKNDAWIVNDREMHVVRPIQLPYSCAYLWLDPARLVGGAAREPEVLALADLGGPGFPNILSPGRHGEEVHIVHQIIQELHVKEPRYQAVVRGLAWTLLARLHRLSSRHPKTAGSPRADRKSMERIAPALHLMADRYAEEITFEQLAAVCHLSLTHFRRLFCRAMGMPPMRYLAGLRIRMAAAMLRGSEKPVIEVALAMGYGALNTFNRHFKQIMGVSPRQWRKSDRGA